MANYTGRLTQQAAVQNFLGINSKSSIVAGKTGEAVDIDNWDIDLSGAITSRLGYLIKSSFINDTRFIDTFFTTEGVQVYIVVSGGNLWEAPAITGPWANRGGTLTTGDYTYVGTSLNGRYMLCNGVDEPIIFTPGQTVDTLKNASLLDPPLSLIGIATGVGSTTYKYVVTSLTPRGESLPSNVATIFNGYATLDATHYITLSWAPRAGAYAQNVYRWNSATSNYDFVSILTGTSNSYVDNSTTSVTSVHPPTANTSYNTPLDWETNGQPEGCFVLSRGRDQRMMAWRKSDVFVSALSNVYDWYSPSDSFAFTVLGGQDSNVKAVATLFDYTLIFSRTNCFIYTGSNYSDIALQKITQTGCSSHYSIGAVGDDMYLWSQFGPTSIRRVLAGADVETNVLGAKISPITFTGTNLSEWTKVKIWHDLVRQRICWALPGPGQTLNTMVLAYNYQTKGWTKFSGWQIEQIAYDPITKNNYAIVSGVNAPSIVQLHTGTSDGGVAIPNSYTAIYEDGRTYLKKRAVFLDVLMDPSTNYNVSVTLNLDFQSPAVPPQTYNLIWDGTNCTTDGESITLRGNLVNTHRMVVFGDARQLQLVFSDLGQAGGVKILGWRIDSRAKGIR